MISQVHLAGITARAEDTIGEATIKAHGTFKECPGSQREVGPQIPCVLEDLLEGTGKSCEEKDQIH